MTDAPASAAATARVPRRPRLLAWAALGLLALVLAAGVALLVISEGLLIVVVGTVSAAVVVAAATGWWAFTTRRRWKRRLNVVLAGLVGLGALLVVGYFSLRFAGAVIALTVLTAGYAEAARRALAAAGRSATAAPGAPEAPDPPVPPRRPWLLVNTRSGGGKAERSGLVAAAGARGVEVHVLTPGQDAAALAESAVAAGADALGAAGGDGTLAPVAAVAVRHRLPFLCVPVGTRNHFAADLGLDRSRPLTALAGLDGSESRVDVATVNGRVFLNNVSLGAYAELVHEQRYRDDKLGTAHAVLPGMVRTDEQRPLGIRFRLPDGTPCTDALLLLVANNPYGPGPAERTARRSLETGLLQISVVRARTGAGLAALLARLSSAGAASVPGGAEWSTAAFAVEAESTDVRAAIDGEAAMLAAPLDFRILPAALRVLHPTGRPGRPLALTAPLQPGTMTALWRLARGRSGTRTAGEPR